MFLRRMKVHPRDFQALPANSHKKLRRLPHVFTRVLELPFRSDANVSVEEHPDCFRFSVQTDAFGYQVKAHTIVIRPGLMKIVVRESGSLEPTSNELEVDVWRCRLPESTLPELVGAVFVDGKLTVRVPTRMSGGEMSMEDGPLSLIGQPNPA